MKGKRDTFRNIYTVLTSVLEDGIEDAYHSGGTGLGDSGFGALDPPYYHHPATTIVWETKLPKHQDKP